MRTSVLTIVVLPLLSFAQAPLCRPSLTSPETLLCSFDGSPLARRDQLELPVPNGKALHLHKVRTARHGSGEIWIGQIAGQPDSEATLVAQGGQLAGNVRTEAGEYYTFRPGPDGLTEVAEYHPSAEAPEVLGVAPASAPADAGPSSRAVTKPRLATPSVIDLLVVYTPAAAAAAGGDAAIRSRIDLATAEANQAFVTSGIQASYRLVGAVAFTPTTINLESPTPAYLLEVTDDAALKLLRDQTGADLVSLWINGTGAQSGASGAAWIMQSPGAGFAPQAYSVVEVNFAHGPHHAFSRALGFNLGGVPDRANAPSPGAYPYAYGFQSLTGKFIDIMAHQQGCKLCLRRNYFSTPAVSFGGFPGGIADPSPNSADLASAFNQTREIVELFRAPGVPITTPPIGPIVGPFIQGLSANPLRITVGEQTLLQWQTQNATALDLSPTGGNVTGTTSLLVAPTATTRYTLTATGPGGGPATAFVDVIVDPVPDPLLNTPPILTFPNSGFYVLATGTPVNIVPINSGGPVTSCTASPALPAGLLLSNLCAITGTPTAAQAAATNRLVYLNSYGGRAQNISITITGDPAPPPVPAPVINSFTATPSTITAGQTSTLTWAVANAVTLSISTLGPVSGSLIVVTPAATTTYVLTATNSAGVSVTASATVTVTGGGGGGSPATVSFISPLPGQTIDGIWYFTLAVPNNILVAQVKMKIDNLPADAYLLFPFGSGAWATGINTIRFSNGAHTATATVVSTTGVEYTASVSFLVGTPAPVPAPVISSFTATPSSITLGQSSTLAWSVANTATLTLTPGGGAPATVTGTSSTSVSPGATTTYVLTATNSAGVSVTASVIVTVTNVPPPPPPAGTGITIVSPTAGQNVSGITFITATAGFTPANPWLDIAVGIRTGRAFANGLGQYVGGLNLTGLAPGSYPVIVTATDTGGTFHSRTVNVTIP